MSKPVKIIVFDDGNGDFKIYPNEWNITKTMFQGGKLELTNVHIKEIKIRSISKWKTRQIEGSSPD